MKMKEIVINKCWGGFELSELAYKELIKLGIPVKKYIEQKRGKDGLYKPEPRNEGKIIFDRKLSIGEGMFNDERHLNILGRYWENWLRDERDNPLLIKVVKKLGEKASGCLSKLKIVKIPANIEWKIDEYDGMESVEENHKSWN